jgi:hydroxyacylglutathione hydrolase
MVQPIATKGASSFLIQGRKGYILIDTGIAKNIRPLESGLSASGIGFKDIVLAIITHAHLDHYGALAAFRRISKAPIAAHRIEAPYIERGEQSPTVARNRAGRFLNVLFKSQRNEACPVDILVDEGLDLAPYGVDGKVFRTSGHTPGSLSVITADGEAIVGDLFRGKPGNRDLGLFCADEAASRESLEKIAALRPRRIFLAHGPEASPAELNSLVESLQTGIVGKP